MFLRLNRARRFESCRGRVCAGQSVADVTRDAPIHRCAKPMPASRGILPAALTDEDIRWDIVELT